MNVSDNQLLIDENEVRAALKPLRPDFVRFSNEVHTRIRVGQKRRIEEEVHRGAEHFRSSSDNTSQDQWLRIAASFLPVHLVGPHFAPMQFTAISLGKKLIVAVAFPFLCLLMIGLTVVGMLQVRSAGKHPKSNRASTDLAQQAIRQWWRRYGWIAAIVFALTLIAPFLGWTTPLMVAMVASGVAAVSMVRTLARQGVFERTAIGGACATVLALLGQASSSFATTNSTQVLDPYLSTGVLFGGAFLIAAILRWSAQPSKRRWFAAGAYLAIAIGIGAVCSQSLWNGSTPLDIQRFVSSSDGMQLGKRELWEQSAQWLNETDLGSDDRLVIERLRQQLDTRFRNYWLTSGIRSGLISDAELSNYVDVEDARTRLVDPFSVDRALTSLEIEYANIAAVTMSNQLDFDSRQLLLGRLMATWNLLSSEQYTRTPIREALLLTELLDRLDPDIDKERRTDEVHRWLDEWQVTERGAFRAVGGFCEYKQVVQSDRVATLNAIDLMQAYGVPEGVDIAKLRSYLRPSFLYDTISDNFVTKQVAREQLKQLAELPAPTAMSYVRSEMILWMSMLLVLLLVYATLTSPVQASDGA